MNLDYKQTNIPHPLFVISLQYSHAAKAAEQSRKLFISSIQTAVTHEIISRVSALDLGSGSNRAVLGDFDLYPVYESGADSSESIPTGYGVRLNLYDGDNEKMGIQSNEVMRLNSLHHDKLEALAASHGLSKIEFSTILAPVQIIQLNRD